MKWRQGYETVFPTKEYVRVLQSLTDGKSKYGEFLKVTSAKVLGIKLNRMATLGLIKKEGRGTYFITPTGSKVLKAYNAYMEIMNDGSATEGSDSSQSPSRSTAKRK